MTTKIIIIPVNQSKNIPLDLQFLTTEFGFHQWNFFDYFEGKSQTNLKWVNADDCVLYFLGMGEKPTPLHIQKAIRSFVFKNKTSWNADIEIYLRHQNFSEFAEAVSLGFHLASYDIGLQKTSKPETWFDKKHQLTILADENIIEACEIGKMMADTQKQLMKWVDEPSNHKTPQMISQWVAESSKKMDLEYTIYDREECEHQGLHALLAVGKGSTGAEPMMVTVEYKHPEAQKRVVLVGKGVTFDTGGVSLKPGDNMNYMKSDMAGAATVYGIVEMAAKLKLKVNLVVIMPLTENCIDGLAIRPGDVIQSYAGKTIEVINTDAEGRLILADALAFGVKNFSPDVMIDMATLTGNTIAALGTNAASMFSKNNEIVDQITAASEKTGEKTWRMPMWDEYSDMMQSDVADIKNLSTAPMAGAITAAKFLEFFTHEHAAWAHLDIAGTAFGDSEYGKMKSATGYGLNLLITWLKDNF